MDRISGLSDELLVKILSFVPTKVAVSTSVLSKRWEYLWMWLPKLEFGHSSYFAESKRLRKFLTKNLPLHRAPVIESFSLDLTKSYSKPKEIRMWVVIVVSHCVRELEIMYSSKYRPNILPSNLYTCESLVILKLDGEILLDVPRMVFLPSLKTLKLLQSVRYSNEESLQRLLSNCPILEDLSVELREKDVTGKLTVAVPSLLSLSLYIPYIHDINGFVIDTPSLEYLKLRDHNVKNHYCLIENMPNLVEAYVDVELPDIKSLIGSITSVERLTICLEAMYDEGFVFNQLEHLELCTCKEHSSDLLVRLLKDSCNLLGIGLSIIDFHEPKGSVYWIQPSTVPECLLSSLQTLKWSDYTGEPEEADVAVYILQNAVHLKTARIKSFESNVPKLEMIQELALASRASTTCKLIFD